MNAVPLLSAFYFGSVEHYRLLAKQERVVLDIGEHYERQSYRTRTSIIGPNGKQDLVVQIERRHGDKMPMRSVGLSYVETWPQQHLHAIRSAYGQTPWFIHYIDDIEAVLLKRYDRLVDLQSATIELGMKWLGLRTQLLVSEKYVELNVPSEVRALRTQVGHPESEAHMTAAWTVDLRNALHPKKPLPVEVTAVPSYPQVFADRHGFVPRLSIMDLVCNCGPAALDHLRAGA